MCSSSPPRLFLSLCAALTERPFYEEWWFLLVMALVGLILILVLVFTLLLHGHSTKYKACSTGVWLRLSNVTLYRVTQWCHSYNCVATSRLSYTKDNCLFACVCCFFYVSHTYIVPVRVNRLTTCTIHWFITVSSTLCEKLRHASVQLYCLRSKIACSSRVPAAPLPPVRPYERGKQGQPCSFGENSILKHLRKKDLTEAPL